MPLDAPAWDPTLQANPTAASADNRGCPPGYACVYTAPAWWSGAGYEKVCLPASTPAAAVAALAAPGAVDQTIINVAEATATPVEAVRDAFEAAGALLPSPGTTGLLIVGVLALLAFSYGFGRSR